MQRFKNYTTCYMQEIHFVDDLQLDCRLAAKFYNEDFFQGALNNCKDVLQEFNFPGTNILLAEKQILN